MKYLIRYAIAIITVSASSICLAQSEAPVEPLNEVKVYIKTYNGHFFVAHDGGGSTLKSDRSAAYEWETFTMVTHDDGTVSFRTYDGIHYLSALHGGGHGLNANATWMKSHEKFEIVSTNDGTNRVALRTYHGQYVVAESAGGEEVNANRTAIGPWEKFEISYVDPNHEMHSYRVSRDRDNREIHVTLMDNRDDNHQFYNYGFIADAAECSLGEGINTLCDILLVAIRDNHGNEYGIFEMYENERFRIFNAYGDNVNRNFINNYWSNSPLIWQQEPHKRKRFVEPNLLRKR